MVSPKDLQAPGNTIICRDFESAERITAFVRMAEAAKRHGSVAIMQLNHPGRQVAEYINPHPASASDVQLSSRSGRTFGKPTPLTREGIDNIVEQVCLLFDQASFWLLTD